MCFERKLTLKKTHDFCKSGKPKLTVVMIHGIAADSTTYNNALAYLEGTTSLKDVRFVTFDLLGSGKSLTSDKLKYDYHEQLEALHNSIEKLKMDTPLVLIGHSMGTFIVTRYADTYKKSVKHLVLISPPIYTEVDLQSQQFKLAMQGFEKAIAARSPEIVESKCFKNEIKYIVENKRNYKVLASLKTHTTLIYGDADQIIASFNIPEMLVTNPKYLTAIKTQGAHGVTRDKYTKLVPILEKVLNG